MLGMKHSGKSHHGAAVAAAVGRPFVDIDEVIQEIDSEVSGTTRTVRKIYREDGEARFRQLETAACRLTENRNVPLVIATGGGICDNQEAMTIVRRGRCVYIHDSLERLAERVLAGGIPPFLNTDDPAVARKRFAELYEHRSRCYRKVADVTVEVVGMNLQEAENTVVQAVKESLSGGK